MSNQDKDKENAVAAEPANVQANQAKSEPRTVLDSVKSTVGGVVCSDKLTEVVSKVAELSLKLKKATTTICAATESTSGKKINR